MGVFADQAAKDYQLTRQQQDAYALETLERAQKATAQGRFKREIAPVETKAGIIDTDELPRKAKPEKIPSLKPAFTEGGTVTAATSSSISDGAAALVLTRESVANKLGKKPIARVVAHAAAAQEPAKFTSAPVPAIQKVLDKAGWSVGDVDLWEVNEAFACVAMIAMRDIGIPHDKINVNGGATALGHPIGASGARITTTLIAALQDRGLKRGVASLCIGGGEATALAVELV
jgi:acetyl-CoA C-acetyltransferase